MNKQWKLKSFIILLIVNKHVFVHTRGSGVGYHILTNVALVIACCMASILHTCIWTDLVHNFLIVLLFNARISQHVIIMICIPLTIGNFSKIFLIQHCTIFIGHHLNITNILNMYTTLTLWVTIMLVHQLLHHV